MPLSGIPSGEAFDPTNPSRVSPNSPSALEMGEMAGCTAPQLEEDGQILLSALCMWVKSPSEGNQDAVQNAYNQFLSDLGSNPKGVNLQLANSATQSFSDAYDLITNGVTVDNPTSEPFYQLFNTTLLATVFLMAAGTYTSKGTPSNMQALKDAYEQLMAALATCSGSDYQKLAHDATPLYYLATCRGHGADSYYTESKQTFTDALNKINPVDNPE